MNLVAWMCQAVGEIAVIGHQQESGGIDIKTSDREKTDRIVSHQVSNNTTSVRIIQCRHNPKGLIKEKISRLFGGPDRFTINQDLAVVGICLIAQLGNLVVDADPACSNQVFSTTSRAVTGGGNYFLQALLHRHIKQRPRCAPAQRQ
jgi:hypothetical protein